MAPTDRFQLPLRWQFVPEESPPDRAIRWKWRAFTQTGRLAMESDSAFDTLRVHGRRKTAETVERGWSAEDWASASR